MRSPTQSMSNFTACGMVSPSVASLPWFPWRLRTKYRVHNTQISHGFQEPTRGHVLHTQKLLLGL
uniref:Uncharacterized protein n=1 Tax=Anguilla anguilla TaxID=7936 RepID=A0A0E9S165_ANGAN